MLAELVGLFDRAAIGPLPVRTWDVRRAPAAYRFLSQARHTGKVVLTMPGGLGRGQRVDHRWHRHGRRAASPAIWWPGTGCGIWCWSVAAAGRHPVPPSWSAS